MNPRQDETSWGALRASAYTDNAPRNQSPWAEEGLNSPLPSRLDFIDSKWVEGWVATSRRGRRERGEDLVQSACGDTDCWAAPQEIEPLRPASPRRGEYARSGVRDMSAGSRAAVPSGGRSRYHPPAPGPRRSHRRTRQHGAESAPSRALGADTTNFAEIAQQRSRTVRWATCSSTTRKGSSDARWIGLQSSPVIQLSPGGVRYALALQHAASAAPSNA